MKSSAEEEKSIYIHFEDNTWYVINKDDDQLQFFTTMPDAFPYPSQTSCCAVAWESAIYMVSATSGELFFIDTKAPKENLAWKKGPRLTQKRDQYPHCLVLDDGRSIFVMARRPDNVDNDDFSASYSWVEILDPLMMLSEFKQHLHPLPHPSSYVTFAIAYGGNKFLVQFEEGGALYCYDVDGNSFTVIDHKFPENMYGITPNSMVVVEDVLYCFAMGVYGYDLVKRRWFNGPVKGLDHKQRTSPYLRGNHPNEYLVHAGKGKLCLVCLETPIIIHCTKFKVCKDDISLHAIIESYQVYSIKNNIPHCLSIKQLLAI